MPNVVKVTCIADVLVPDTRELVAHDPWDMYTPLQQAQINVSDCHKDVYGFRPRHYSHDQWNSLEFMDAELVRIIAAGRANGTYIQS